MKVLFILAFFILSIFCVAQENKISYPLAIKPGNIITISGKNPQEISFDSTLWILKDKQLRNALNSHKQLEIYKEENKLLLQKIDTIDEKLVQQAILIDTLSRNVKYYQTIWKRCSDNTLVLEKQFNKKKKMMPLIVGGGVVFSILTFILGAKLF